VRVGEEHRINIFSKTDQIWDPSCTQFLQTIQKDNGINTTSR
jgi:hypothetical protein